MAIKQREPASAVAALLGAPGAFRVRDASPPIESGMAKFAAHLDRDEVDGV